MEAAVDCTVKWSQQMDFPQNFRVVLRNSIGTIKVGILLQPKTRSLDSQVRELGSTGEKREHSIASHRRATSPMCWIVLGTNFVCRNDDK